MESNEQYKSLVDMGCSAILSEAAILNLKSQDLSALLDWISDHSEEEEKWQKWLEERKNSASEEKVEPALTQSIDHLVKKELSEELQKKGHSKNVAQKALLFTSNVSVRAAENWIEEHKYDPDFEEEAFIEGQNENQPKLTPEEAKIKLKELVDKARETKRIREEEDAREREKNRVKFGKEMTEAKRIAEEQAIKRQAELDKIQKARDEEYKKKLVEQMRREKMEKLGKKEEVVPGSGAPVPVAKAQVKYSKLEQLEIQCQQVKVGMHAYPDKAKVFFETANIYVGNIIKNNGEEKFRKINKENKAFQGRVAEVFGGVETLEVIGYTEDNGFLVLKSYDLKQLQSIASLLQRYISYYD